MNNNQRLIRAKLFIDIIDPHSVSLKTRLAQLRRVVSKIENKKEGERQRDSWQVCETLHRGRPRAGRPSYMHVSVKHFYHVPA